MLDETTTTLSDFKKNPVRAIAAAQGATVAVIEGNSPVFYCVPARAYEALMERLEDAELNAIADTRAHETVVTVTLSDL